MIKNRGKHWCAVSLILITPWLHGCSLTYLAKASYHQIKVLKRRVPIHKVLQDPQVQEGTKEKLRLVEEVKGFAENVLKLKRSDNYSSFVQLDGPYVTYLLRVSSARQLSSYQWTFPFVGKFPYKGYFSREEAEKAAKKFPESEYDTYVRGVTAYSTLGWFDDPVFSSMLGYSHPDLVATIIHEMVHATLFIKGHAGFNERLATFVGHVGTELFYKQKEGENSPTVQMIKDKNRDNLLFSRFISEELKRLKEWYRKNEGLVTRESKAKRLRDIQDRFKKDLQPNLKSLEYDYFLKLKLNNARLLSYETYISDLSAFEKLYVKLDEDFFKMMTYLKNLETSGNPEKALKEYVKEE